MEHNTQKPNKTIKGVTFTYTDKENNSTKQFM